MVKQYLQYLFFIFFILSCRTSQELSEFGEEDVDASFSEEFEEGDQSAAEFGEEEFEEDFEDEFAESEDLEAEISGESEFDSEVEGEASQEEVSEEEITEEEVAEEEVSEEDLELVDEEDLDLIDEDESEQLAEGEVFEEKESVEELAEGEEPGQSTDEELTEGEEPGQSTDEELAEGEELGQSTDEELAEGEEPGQSTDEELAEGEEPGQSTDEELAEGEEPGQSTDEELAEGEEPGQSTDEELAEATSVVINSIRYDDSENKVYIEGTDSLSYQTRENASTNQIIIEIPNAVLADSLKWPFVMKDFNTQIGMLQADQKNGNIVRVVVQMREGASSPSVEVSDSGALVIASGRVEIDGESGSMIGDALDGATGADRGSVLPAKSFEEFFTSVGKFSGQPISIHLKNVDIRDVLYFISEETGLNMVISDDVTGSLSIKLRNVPWDQALITIMKTKKLGYLREGNVIRIMTLNALKSYQQEIDIMKTQSVAPMQVKVIPIVYTKASEIVPSLKPFLTPTRGQALVDNRSNAIILTDTAEVLERVHELVKYMDTPPKQVMIEAKIVEARESFVRNLGLNWNVGLENFEKNSVFGQPNWDLNLNGNLNIFPAAESGGSRITERTLVYPFNIAFTPVGLLDAVISIAETDGVANVISSPRVLVLSGKRATISQRTQNIDVVTQQSSDTGQTLGQSPQKTPVVLTFTVAPEVTAIGSVFMDINMQRDFVGNRDVASGSRPINSRQASTSVLASNGQTIVIGGIYQSDKTQFKEGIPFLRHIPILKWFFSQRITDENRNELLLFVTPRVLNSEQRKSVSPEIDSFSSEESSGG